MKCDTCRYEKMCRLRMKYEEAVSMVAEITNTREPEYSQACNVAAGLFEACVNYEEKG